MSFLRYVPWLCQADWQTVYDDVYSDDFQRQENACRVMEVWMYRPNDCPPAVDCTKSLVQVMLKDETINHTAPTADSGNLNLLYSSAIMKTINTVTGSSKKNRQTMKQSCRTLGIPDWIVALRHQVSHGFGSAPELATLRAAATFLKQWLKESYWEVERTETRDWVIERPRKLVVEESVRALVRIYVHVKKSASLYYQSMAKIEKPHIKSAICSMGQYRVSAILAEIAPWDIRCSNAPKDNVRPKEVEEMPPRDALKQVLSYCRPYLGTDFWNLDTSQMLVDGIVEENSDSTELKRSIWANLIQCIHSWSNLPKLMLALAKTASCQLQGDSQRIASAWLEELLLAVAKRLKVDKMRAELTKLAGEGCPTGEGDSKELRVMRKLLLKRRLDMGRSKESTVTLELMRRVGKAEPRLKNALKLVHPASVHFGNATYREMMFNILEAPNKYSVKCLPLLIDLFEPPMKSQDMNDLLYLVKIYNDSEMLPTLRPGVRTFTVQDVERLQRSRERKHGIDSSFGGRDDDDDESEDDSLDESKMEAYADLIENYVAMDVQDEDGDLVS